jgi:hypothetical protein
MARLFAEGRRLTTGIRSSVQSCLSEPKATNFRLLEILTSPEMQVSTC